MPQPIKPVAIDEAADWNETDTRRFKITNPRGATFPIDVTYYPNRITGEDYDEPADDDGDDEDDEGSRWAREGPTPSSFDLEFAGIIAEWSVVGPVRDRAGAVIVAKDEPVPLDPAVLRYVALWLKQRIRDEIIKAIFPNASESRPSRRR